jgi:hypothetical protein
MKHLFVLLFIITLSSCTDTLHIKLGKENAAKELDNALNDTTQQNVVDNKEFIIKDSNTAIKVAEPILFEIYGKSNIEEQKPYETYLIGNYWVLNGTLVIGSLGGTFLIVIDARNSKVIKIIHGK